jgi:hypothetical protein
MIQGSLSREWDVYLTTLREDAHLLLAWGHADARRQLAAARDEYDITGFLADAMDRRINHPLTHERFSLYSVHNERPVSPHDEAGKARPKLDLQIELCGVRPKRCYTFEAKRLRDDQKAAASDSVSHYIGAEGVGRFVAGRYEGDRIEAAMIGCIQARDASFWLQLFTTAFAEDAASGRNSLKIVQQLQRCRVIDELPEEASSIHGRVGGSAIRLLHVFLLCA